MTPPRPEVDAVVSKLTKAQRDAIVDGLARYTDPNTTRSLRKKALCERRGTMLTMLGLAVRNSIIEQEQAK